MNGSAGGISKELTSISHADPDRPSHHLTVRPVQRLLELVLTAKFDVSESLWFASHGILDQSYGCWIEVGEEFSQSIFVDFVDEVTDERGERWDGWYGKILSRRRSAGKCYINMS